MDRRFVLGVSADFVLKVGTEYDVSFAATKELQETNRSASTFSKAATRFLGIVRLWGVEGSRSLLCSNALVLM
jgi:hypothetical protein